jgi:hypothetical protein
MDKDKNLLHWALIMTECPKLYSKDIDFECGPGWYSIIHDLSLEIEQILNENPLFSEIHAVQIKQKYGTLRFYMSEDVLRITNLIQDAEALSSQTCETCGKPGKMRGRHWFEVKCDECFKEYK